MREILYFQAGKISNYIGTHFWNAQEGYFTYGDDAEEPIVNHDISFREASHLLKGESTFCPRVLLFDRKSNFGSLSDLYGDTEIDEPEELLSQWNGDVVEYRHNAVEKSDYHARLESAAESAAKKEPEHTGVDKEPYADESQTRFWADYSRVFFHPRSVHCLPDLPEWEAVEGDWAKGREEFKKMDEQTNFMEETFRSFVEECDNIQGLQIMNDMATFGSFTSSFLTQLRDEFIKLATFSFPVLSGVVPRDIDIGDTSSLMKAFNDALCLRGLSELSTLNVPIQNPLIWKHQPWNQYLKVDFNNLYHTSALLSTHIESTTLPSRFKSPTQFTHMHDLSSLLNWRGNTRFSNLSGAFPLQIGKSVKFEADVTCRLYDFSSGLSAMPPDVFSRVDVSRGFSQQAVRSYVKWAGQFQPSTFSYHAPASSMPTSYPRIFDPSISQYPNLAGFSSLAASPVPSAMFSSYAAFVDSCMRRKPDILLRLNLEREEARDLRDDLWVLEDAYKAADNPENVQIDEDD